MCVHAQKHACKDHIHLKTYPHAPRVQWFVPFPRARQGRIVKLLPKPNERVRFFPGTTHAYTQAYIRRIPPTVASPPPTHTKSRSKSRKWGYCRRDGGHCIFLSRIPRRDMCGGTSRGQHLLRSEQRAAASHGTGEGRLT